MKVFFELLFGAFTAFGTVGSCLIALGIINPKRFRVKRSTYNFGYNRESIEKADILNSNSIEVVIGNANSNKDLVIQNIFFTTKNRETCQFHLCKVVNNEDIIEISIMPGAKYKFNSHIYKSIGKELYGDFIITSNEFKSKKPVKVLDVIKEWQKEGNNIEVPQIYFDTNLGYFLSKPSKQAKKIWKKLLKQAKISTK